MKFFLLALSITTIGIFCGTAQGQVSNAKLEIRVMKRPYGENTSRPFVGVGVFDLLRGGSKVEGASCPDKSGISGGVNCFIPCQADQNTPITIQVKPPSDQDHLAGWVTPAAQIVELRGCKLVPQLVTMKYDDAKYAINDILTKYAVANHPNSNTSDQWIEAFKSDSTQAAKVAEEATTSASGRNDLLSIFRFASEGSKAYKLPRNKLSADEAEESLTLTKWQILSKSALLGAQVEKIVPENQRRMIKFEVTGDVTSYLTSLQKADSLLSAIKEKTPEQRKLADDIKTLRSMPVTGMDAQAALPIIQQWK
ncbi:MAG: hypothetical protein K9K30_02200 [Burkholderiaceae bacterium]|nr:hypothetical protein [Sulfuritalea sp.]MCF8174027.1 hypothetical protein [Burkholderiaceae bacterium]